MNQIIKHYVVNEKTMAFIPAFQFDFDTYVLETNNRWHVRQTPKQLIETACLNDWSPFNGRRKAVIHHTGFAKKTPIPIYLSKQIIAFPTNALDNFTCAWLFPAHIASIKKHPTDCSSSIITFKNRKAISLPVTEHILQTQMTRSFIVLTKIKEMEVQHN